MVRPGILESLPQEVLQDLCFSSDETPLREIHLRCGRPTEIVRDSGSQLLPYCATAKDLQLVLDRASGHALYAVQDYLREGFCTTSDGCRIGIAGTVSRDAQGVRSVRDLSSLTLRIAREVRGTAEQAAKEMVQAPGSVLILGPPGCGKTTLLRDLIRMISDDWQQRIAVADTRFELGAVTGGIPSLYLGKRTDLVSGGELEDSILQLLRTMNPQWIAADEITKPSDVEAVERCSNCGVYLLATVHALDRRDLSQRPVSRMLLQRQIFQYLVEMDRPGRYRVHRMEEGNV